MRRALHMGDLVQWGERWYRVTGARSDMIHIEGDYCDYWCYSWEITASVRSQPCPDAE